ncbi:MAG: response regulator [SAR324 cluster bacterium]|nr:response regulator [SAR324 cluster bacterium]
MNTSATILICDDNEANRILLNDLILSIGHVPLLAENGLSALAQIRTAEPDLVLLDILMPEMDGFGVLQRMRAEGLLPGIPVIVISSVDEVESIVRCIQEGADDYLIKPFNQVLLTARISASLQKKQFRDREQEFQRLIEEYNLNLEARVREEVTKNTDVELQRAKLSRYLSPKVVEEVLKSERPVDLGGTNTFVTVLFTDIRGYTGISHEMPAGEVMEFLNEHFTDLSRIVFDYEGTLDKFIGDSVMAVFGWPFSTDHDELNAVGAARRMQEAVKKRNEKWAELGRLQIKMGIGINSGNVIAGNLGSPQKMDFTVIGETVNISARLQGIAQGGEIIVGAPTYEKIRGELEFDDIGKVSLKNLKEPFQCYRLKWE